MITRRPLGSIIRPRRPVVSGVLALLAVALVGTISSISIAPPDPTPASAPPTLFSAQRAFTHVQQVGRQPHPTGTAANDRVRGYLVEELRALGLNPRVQRAVGRDPSPGRRTTLATVRNVVAVLPGSAPSGRVLLVAHYDSVAAGPGANDDGAGTAALLETARSLTTSPRPRNDIVFVFTDAEEDCLCGAEAFVHASPLAAEGGVVLNLEARGSSGPAVMFETSTPNSWLIDVFADAAPHPLATSFAVNVYRLLARDTDFTAFLRAEQFFAGLNSAYFDGSAVYHTPLDTPASMSLASVQHHGANTLAMARALGAADLEQARQPGNATFFPVAGTLVHYPSVLNWPLAVLSCLAVLALALLARRRGAASLPRILAGAGLAVLAVLLAGLAGAALWRGIVALWPQYAAYGTGDPYHPVPLRLAVLVLVAGVLLGWYVLARKIGPAALAIGALSLPALVGIGAAAVVPGGSYLGSIPALVAAGAAIAALATRRRPYIGVVSLAVAGSVAAVVYVPTVTLLSAALGLGSAGVLAAFAALCALVLLPLVELVLPTRKPVAGRVARVWRHPAALPAIAVLVTLALVATGLWANRVSDNRPRPTHLMYALDADTGSARWYSGARRPSTWTARYVSRSPHAPVDFPLLGQEPLRSGPAPAATLGAPDVTVLRDTVRGDRRSLRLRVSSTRDARVLGLYLPDGVAVRQVTVQGRRIPVRGTVEPVGPWGFGFTYIAPPDTGIEVSLSVRHTGPLRLRVVDRSEGLAGLPGFTPRQEHLVTAAGHRSDLVLVGETHTV